MDEMLDPEMARLRAMRVADLIDGLVGLDREPFELGAVQKGAAREDGGCGCR